jgi:hypothetical protein
MAAPSKAIGLIKGAKGKRLLRSCLAHGVSVEVPSAIFADESEPCRILLAGSSEEAIANVEAELRQLIKTAMLTSESMTISAEILDWLLHSPRQRMALLSNLMRHGTCLGYHADSLEVHGESPGAVQMTLKGIYTQLYEYQSVTVELIVQSAALQGQLERCLAFLCASFSAQTRLSSSPHNALTLKVSGSKNAVEATFDGLQQSLPQVQGLASQVTWSFATASEVREFVSGKKDGKIVKIMRETDVMIGLEAIGVEHLRIALMGPSIAQVMGALRMVRGELPAETVFYIPEAHHKRLIGHGGKVIQQVMKRHAVYIKFLNAQEAKERVLGTGAALTGEPTCATRLDNVIVRTPAKNGGVLEEVKAEVLGMADLALFPHEDGTCCSTATAGCTETKAIRLSKQGLLGLSESARRSLSACLFTAFGGSVELGLGQRQSWFDDDALVLQMSGSRQALDRLYATLHGGNLMAMAEEAALFSISESAAAAARSPRLCPASPTTSNASQSHPVHDLQELFFLFGTALYTVASPALSIRSSGNTTKQHAPVSPQMSDSEWSQLSWSPKSSTNAHHMQSKYRDSKPHQEDADLHEAARIFDSFYNLPTGDDPIVTSPSIASTSSSVASPSFSLAAAPGKNPHGPIGRKASTAQGPAFDPFKVKDWRAASTTWSRHHAW